MYNGVCRRGSLYWSLIIVLELTKMIDKKKQLKKYDILDFKGNLHE